MIYDKITNLDKNLITIIGSGPASLTLAIELHKKKIPCQILEAGKLSFSRESQNLYKGKIIGDAYFPLDECRYRQFGGSSAGWAGWCINLDEWDFEKWPIKKKDLDIYLDDACKYLDIKNNFFRKKLDNNFDQINIQYSPPTRFGKKFFSLVRSSKYINLYLNTPLLKINVDDQSKFSCKSIDVMSQDKIKTFEIKNLVLGMGGIENPRILQISQQKSVNTNFKSINIGNFWSEHPHMSCGYIVGDKKKIYQFFKNKLITRDELMFIATNKDFQKRNKLNNFMFKIEYENPEEEKFLIEDLKKCLDKAKKSIREINLDCALNIDVVWEQDRKYENKVHLSNEKDSLGLNKVELYYKKNLEDFRIVESSLIGLNDFLQKNKLGYVGFKNFIKDKIWPNTGEEGIGGNHHLCSTPMGYEGEELSVVDKNHKMFNSKNIYIIGSSVFRTGGFANPTLTIVQMSLRFSDYINKNKQIFA